MGALYQLRERQEKMKIAITGGIGTGKSTFLTALRAYLPHYDFRSFDEGVHALYQRADVQLELIETFGTLDRTEISDRVFTNSADLATLESLFAPYIENMVEEWSRLDNVVVEFPLLFEKGFDRQFDVIVAVVADESVRISRVQQRNGFTAEKVKSIINQQLDKAFFDKTVVDFIVDTSSNPDVYRLAKRIAYQISAQRIGVVAGSFDPITEGHLWLIEKALEVVDVVNIVVAQNPAKKGMFSLEQRSQLVADSLHQKGINSSLWHVSVLPKEKLLISYADEIGASFVFRGIRNVTDFDYESQINLVQKKIVPEIETIFLMPPQHLTEVSSSLVKSLIGLEGWERVVKQYVSPAVLNGLRVKSVNTSL